MIKTYEVLKIPRVRDFVSLGGARTRQILVLKYSIILARVLIA